MHRACRWVFGKGLACSSNIKAWMLALTLSAGWVVNAAGQPAANPGERLAIVRAVTVGFAFSSNFVYALIGSLLRQWLAQGTRPAVVQPCPGPGAGGYRQLDAHAMNAAQEKGSPAVGHGG